MTEQNKWAEKIGKLLAKAERTDNPHEREAFSRQAERLMVKWGIEEAMARAAGGGEVKPEQIITREIDFRAVGSTYAKGVLLSMYSVVRALGLDGYHSGHNRLFVVGHESDVERAEMLIASLRLQQISSMDSWYKNEDWLGTTAHEKWRAKMDFMVSFGSAVAKRLREMNREEVDATLGAALALRDRAQEVKDHMAAMNLGKSRASNFGGSAAGRAAGERANLGEKSVSGRRQIG